MEQGRALLHGLLGVQHEGVFLVFHLNGRQRLGGGHWVLRHHGGDIVPVEAHPLGEHQPVGHVLMARVGGPGMPGGGEKVLFLYVKTGKDLDHPGNGLGAGGIDGFDQAIGDGGVENLGHVGPLVAQVIGVFGAA